MKPIVVEIAVVVGFLLPHLIAIVSQQTWRPGFKSVVAFGICLGAAAVATWARGGLNLHDFLGSAGVIWTVAQASYRGLWKPTGIVDAVESSTTIKTAP